MLDKCWLIRRSDFPGSSVVKESACNVGDMGLIPGLGRSPAEGNGNPLQYSCLENYMDRGAWWTTVHGVTKSWIRLTDFHFQGDLVSFLYEFLSSFFFLYHFVTLTDLIKSLSISTVQQTYTVPVMCQVQRSSETDTVSEASGLMRQGLQRPSSGKGCSIGFHYCFRNTRQGMSIDEVERKAETR